MKKAILNFEEKYFWKIVNCKHKRLKIRKIFDPYFLMENQYRTQTMNKLTFQAKIGWLWRKVRVLTRIEMRIKDAHHIEYTLLLTVYKNNKNIFNTSQNEWNVYEICIKRGDALPLPLSAIIQFFGFCLHLSFPTPTLFLSLSLWNYYEIMTSVKMNYMNCFPHFFFGATAFGS